MTTKFELTAEEVEIVKELSSYLEEVLSNKTLNEISMEELNLYEYSTNLFNRIKQWQESNKYKKDE